MKGDPNGAGLGGEGGGLHGVVLWGCRRPRRRRWCTLAQTALAAAAARRSTGHHLFTGVSCLKKTKDGSQKNPGEFIRHSYPFSSSSSPMNLFSVCWLLSLGGERVTDNVFRIECMRQMFSEIENFFLSLIFFLFLYMDGNRSRCPFGEATGGGGVRSWRRRIAKCSTRPATVGFQFFHFRATGHLICFVTLPLGQL